MPHWWDHKWEDKEPDHILGPPERKCSFCGVEQYLHEEHAWMRKVGEYWYPKIKRRCPKAIKPMDT